MGPSYSNQKAAHSSQAAASNNLRRITGIFKEEKGKGFDVRVTDEILAALSTIAVGDYLKVYQNTDKNGKDYLSLAVKSLPPRG